MSSVGVASSLLDDELKLESDRDMEGRAGAARAGYLAFTAEKSFDTLRLLPNSVRDMACFCVNTGTA